MGGVLTMPFELSFKERIKYPTLEAGITLEAVLLYGGERAVCDAKVDTGAEHCLFSRELGESLGIDVERGMQVRLGTFTGSLVAYGHNVTLITGSVQLQAFVCFAADYELPRNILGREGWLRLVRLAIIDYDEELYLSHYNDSL